MNRENRTALHTLYWIIAVVLALAGVIGWIMRDRQPVLNLYVWDGYYPPEILAEFEAESGARIKLSTYDSNDQMIARVKVSWSEFDVIMPSNYVIDQMRRSRLLAPMRHEEVPNVYNVMTEFFDGTISDDEDLEYAIPYMLNFAGIGYQPSLVLEPPATWRDYFGADLAGMSRDRLAVLDEGRETMGLALIALGYSPNTEDPQQLEELRAFLRAQKTASEGGAPRFVLAEGRDLLVSRQISLLATWSPEITLAQMEDPEIKYVMPLEGSILTYDTLAVPRSSRQQELAKQFINFSLRPDIAQRMTHYNRYANSLRPELDHTESSVAGTPSYQQPPRDKIYVLEDVGDARHLYDTIWVEYRRRNRP